MKTFNEFNLITESALTDKVVVILRGVPGSGKSTFAELLANGDQNIICCADDYFMNNGKYEWDATKLTYAHNACKEKFKSLLDKNAPLIIVANTNTKEKDFAEYIKLGENAGYTIFSIIVENRHNGTNIHNVPDEKVNQFRRKFDISL